MGNKKTDNKKTVVRNKSGKTTAGVTAVEKKSAEETPGVSGRRGLSSLQLKIITVIAFLAGNTALMFVDGEANYYSYFALRSIGMMVLPLAVFLMTEGFKHTSNKKMYFVRMFAFGFAAEVPYVTFVNKVFDEKFAKPVAKLLETDKLKLESDSLGKLAEIVSDKKMAYFEDIYNTCYM